MIDLVQRSFKEELRFSADGFIEAWQPRAQYPHVLIDPNRQFGEPIVEPGVPAAVLAPARLDVAATPPAFRASRLDQWFDLDAAADPLGPGSPLAAAESGAAPAGAKETALSTPAPVRPMQPMPPIPPRAAAPTPVAVAGAQPPAVAPPADAAALRRAFLRGAGLAAGARVINLTGSADDAAMFDLAAEFGATLKLR